MQLPTNRSPHRSRALAASLPLAIAETAGCPTDRTRIDAVFDRSCSCAVPRAKRSLTANRPR